MAYPETLTVLLSNLALDEQRFRLEAIATFDETLLFLITLSSSHLDIKRAANFDTVAAADGAEPPIRLETFHQKRSRRFQA